jgi:hypothetical protein
MLDVLEHIKSDYYMLKKAYSLLVEGGYLIFSVPAHKSLYSNYDRYLGHYRRYEKHDLESMLGWAKFDKIYLSYKYCLLYLPIILGRKVGTGHAPRLPSWLNNICIAVMDIEIILMYLGLSMPFGISIVGVYQRPWGSYAIGDKARRGAS